MIEDSKKEPGNNGLLLSKDWEIFKNIYKKRSDKVDKLSKTIDYGDLNFIGNDSVIKTNSSKLKDL